MDWYYTEKGQQRGPVSDDQIKRLAHEGRLSPDAYVWNATMGDQWTEARNTPGLFENTPVEPAAPQPGDDTERFARGISCTAAVGPAWQGMKHILFRPFEIGKWFVIGFSAWLASLGDGGGSGGGNYRTLWSDKDKAGLRDLFKTWETHVLPFIKQHGPAITLVGITVTIVLVATTLVVLWLRARGKFMFLDNVLNNRAEVSRPWRVFAQHGNSLFRWTLGYTVVCLVIGLLLGAVTVFSVVKPCFDVRAFTPVAIPGIVASAMLWLTFVVATLYIGRFLEDFVIPIMYKHDLTTREAWNRFLRILRPNAGRFVVYGLFYVLLSMAAGLLILLLFLATCLMAACIVAIPYVGTVLLLPVFVFFRLYSLEYLAQYGPDFTLEPE